MVDLIRWNTLGFYALKLIDSLPVTLAIVFVSTILGLILGIIIAVAQLERLPVLRQLCIVFISFIRGTPILIQMFIVYYGLPMLLLVFGIDITRIDKIYFIYITYGINTGAYFSEIIRTSILSVPKAQKDAAAAMGLSKLQAYRRIIVPQCAVIAIPSVSTTMTSLLQDTSLAFSIGIIDVVGRVRALGSLSSRVLEGYIVAACIFIVLSILLEKMFALLEKKTAYTAAISA